MKDLNSAVEGELSKEDQEAQKPETTQPVEAHQTGKMTDEKDFPVTPRHRTNAGTLVATSKTRKRKSTHSTSAKSGKLPETKADKTVVDLTETPADTDLEGVITGDSVKTDKKKTGKNATKKSKSSKNLKTEGKIGKQAKEVLKDKIKEDKTKEEEKPDLDKKQNAKKDALKKKAEKAEKKVNKLKKKVKVAKKKEVKKSKLKDLKNKLMKAFKKMKGSYKKLKKA